MSIVSINNELAIGGIGISPNDVINLTGSYNLSDVTDFQLGAYSEYGTTLTISANTLTIPLDGKIYSVSVNSIVTSISTVTPDLPGCGSAIIYFNQNTTGYAISYPNTWYWPSGVATNISSTANSNTRLILVTDPTQRIHADAEIRSIPV